MDRACAGDESIRREVEELLDLSPLMTQSFLEHAPTFLDEEISEETLEAGTQLRRFRIDGLLGRGGMGEVYEGFDETLKRPVAIKLMHTIGVIDLHLDRLPRGRELLTDALAVRSELLTPGDPALLETQRRLPEQHTRGRVERWMPTLDPVEDYCRLSEHDTI